MTIIIRNWNIISVKSRTYLFVYAGKAAKYDYIESYSGLFF